MAQYPKKDSCTCQEGGARESCEGIRLKAKNLAIPPVQELRSPLVLFPFRITSELLVPSPLECASGKKIHGNVS